MGKSYERSGKDFYDTLTDVIRYEIGKQVNKIFACYVDSVNDDGTLNVYLLEDIENKTLLTNITNQTPYVFESGEEGFIFAIRGELNNAFMIAKGAPKTIQTTAAQSIIYVSGSGGGSSGGAQGEQGAQGPDGLQGIGVYLCNDIIVQNPVVGTVYSVDEAKIQRPTGYDYVQGEIIIDLLGNVYQHIGTSMATFLFPMHGSTETYTAGTGISINNKEISVNIPDVVWVSPTGTSQNSVEYIKVGTNWYKISGTGTYSHAITLNVHDTVESGHDIKIKMSIIDSSNLDYSTQDLSELYALLDKHYYQGCHYIDTADEVSYSTMFEGFMGEYRGESTYWIPESATYWFDFMSNGEHFVGMRLTGGTSDPSDPDYGTVNYLRSMTPGDEVTARHYKGFWTDDDQYRYIYTQNIPQDLYMTLYILTTNPGIHCLSILGHASTIGLPYIIDSVEDEVKQI